MKLSKKIVLTLAMLLGSVGLVSAATVANGAQSSLLPAALQSLLDLMGPNGQNTGTFISGKVQFVIYLVMGMIILVAVVYSILAGIKYIRSEGDPGKIEEAQKSIKSILMGVAAIFVGILGIVLVYVIFGVGIISPSTPEVCISANNSVGCYYFTKQGGAGINEVVVQWCEALYKVASTKDDKNNFKFPNGLKDTTNQTLLYTLAQTQATLPTAENTQAVDPLTGTVLSGFTQAQAIDLCLNPTDGGLYTSLATK